LSVEGLGYLVFY